MLGQRALGALVIVGIATAVGAVGWSLATRGQAREEHCLSALRELAPSVSGHPSSRRVALPASYAHLAEDGQATVIRTRDGRGYLLVKSSLGAKGNFRGVLCGDSELAPAEQHASAAGGAIVFDDGAVSLELAVRRQVSPRVWEVYFDLN